MIVKEKRQETGSNFPLSTENHNRNYHFCTDIHWALAMYEYRRFDLNQRPESIFHDD